MEETIITVTCRDCGRAFQYPDAQLRDCAANPERGDGLCPRCTEQRYRDDAHIGVGEYGTVDSDWNDGDS